MNDSASTALSGTARAVRTERIDADNWLDDFAAAPAPVAAALGLAVSRQGDLAMVRSHLPFSRFNRVMTPGCPAPADPATLAAIERFYGDGKVGRHWILVHPFSQPPDLAERLVERGYRPDGAWGRVVLQGVPEHRWAVHAQGCDVVTAESATDWRRFVVGCCRVPPFIGEWPRALVGRRRWTHAIRRAGGRADGPVVMARRLFQDDDGWVWRGIDAPVPGVMAACHEDDQRVVATLRALGAARGAPAFVSDIEVPGRTRDSEADRRRGEPGFVPVYRRAPYARGGAV